MPEPLDSVIVTGLGAVSCLGSGVDLLWQGMTTGSSAPVRPSDPNANVPIPLLYAVPPDAVPPLPAEAAGPVGPATRFAIESVRQAVEDARLDETAWRRVAVVVGTGMGQAGLYEQWRVDGFPDDAQWAPVFSVGSAVGDWFGFAGSNTCVSNACAASGCAVSIAADMVRAGETDVAIAIGADAYSRVALACFNRMGALDPKSCRPFATNRLGTVFGEAAAALVLESVAHATARRAPTVYATVSGAGWSCDAYHPTAPEPTGRQIARAMSDALAEAGATVDQIGCLVPHGTGTDLNDRIESEAINEVLGPQADNIPLYSLKALIGHTGGAAGAMSVLAATLMLHHRTVPGNVALAEQDPDCRVWLPGTAVRLTGRYGIVSAYAFGGNNISLVLGTP